MKKLIFAFLALFLFSSAVPAMGASPRVKSLREVRARNHNSGKISNNPFTWLSFRYVTESDLYGMSGSDLRILRNAIYAMKGRKFKSADLHNYFSQYSWYHPRYNEVRLNDIEQYNANFIMSYE